MSQSPPVPSRMSVGGHDGHFAAQSEGPREFASDVHVEADDGAPCRGRLGMLAGHGDPDRALGPEPARAGPMAWTIQDLPRRADGPRPWRRGARQRQPPMSQTRTAARRRPDGRRPDTQPRLPPRPGNRPRRSERAQRWSCSYAGSSGGPWRSARSIRSSSITPPPPWPVCASASPGPAWRGSDRRSP